MFETRQLKIFKRNFMSYVLLTVFELVQKYLLTFLLRNIYYFAFYNTVSKILILSLYSQHHNDNLQQNIFRTVKVVYLGLLGHKETICTSIVLKNK